MRKSIPLSLFAAVLLSAPFASGTDVYVSPSGDDGAAGTAQAPLKTIGKAVSKVAGKEKPVVRLLSGTYRLTRPVTFGSEAAGVTVRADVPGRAILSGAVPVTGWKRDPSDKRLLVAKVPFDLGETRKFRTLTVGTNNCPLAAYPGYGDAVRGFLRTSAEYKAQLKVGGGGFEPTPTHAELVTLPVDLKRTPKGFDLTKVDFRNAWIDLWHMWHDSPCEIASNDVAKGVLYLAQEPTWPVGMMNDRFELMNVREGLLEPGNWMIDRAKREIVYFPRKGEDEHTLEAALAKTEQLVVLSGAHDLVLSGLVLEGCAAPFKNLGFGGSNLDGALEIRQSADVTVENVTVRHVAGAGARISGDRIRLTDCDIGFTGSQALSFGGSDGELLRSRIHDSGRSTHAASLLGISGVRMQIVGNRLWNAPYSGVIMSGERHLYASNDVSRVMRVLQDGGALYGGYAYCVIRDNFHHDMMDRCFKGYGQSGYYADEGSHDNLITGNRSEGVETAVHNHITRNNVVSNNVFSSPTKLHISFARSVNGVFTDNRCYFIDEFSFGRDASDIGEWARNQLFRGKKAGQPLKTYAKAGDGDWDLQPLPPKDPYVASSTTRPPKFDGVLERNEWGMNFGVLGRDEFGCGLGGNPTTMRALFDKSFLYVLVEPSYYTNLGEKPTIGGRWGRADAVRLEFGKSLVVTLFSDGSCTSSDPAVALRTGVDYYVSVKGRAALYALRLPYAALGRKGPTAGELAFNVTSYVTQHDEYRFWDAPSIANPVPGILFFGSEAAKDGMRDARKRQVR